MKKYIRYIFFPVIFIYFELLFKIFTGKQLQPDFIYPIFSSIILGGLIAVVTSLFSKNLNRFIGYTLITAATLIFGLNIVYFNIFKTSFTFSLVFGGAEAGNAITQFAGNTISAIQNNTLALIFCLLPLILTIIFDIFFNIFKKINIKISLVACGNIIIIFAIYIYIISSSGNNGYTANILYFEQFVRDISFEKLGVITSTRIDLKELVFGVNENLSDIDKAQEMPTILDNENQLTDYDSESPSETTAENITDNDTESIPVEKPIPTGPNILNIDFNAFTAGENGSYIKWLNDFYSVSAPTNKNQYTGMFEGYNLILITAESFSQWAVSKEYTPTLYKLVNEGFVFENFYTHAFNNTTAGEWSVCTGLLPNGMGSTSFSQSVTNGKKYMGMCMGNILSERGYSTNAYHNHTYSYYNRDETHPNMGYTYKGLGSGLDVNKSWPESDLEMMQLSVDDYINNEKFHAYYMTVSGHLEYTWTGNRMASKNRDLVADMDATESMKAYMACNIELDKALENLINRLEEKGVADKTIIAMACDHYPYALEDELSASIGAESTEFYGLYKNSLVIWSGSMKDPVHIKKVCGSADIIPTLLNLMGIEYDSRLYSGRDILSDTPGLVVFSNMGFATDFCIYNASTGNFKATSDVEITKDYINSVRALAKNIWDASGRIITTDYYSKMQKYIKE